MQAKRSRAVHRGGKPQPEIEQSTCSAGLPYTSAPDNSVQETLQQQLLRLEALRQIELSIISELDLETLLLSIVSYSVELTRGSGGGFFICRPERGFLEWVIAVGMDPSPIGFTVRQGEGLAGKVWESGRSLIVNDYPGWQGRFPAEVEFPYSAVIGAPVCWKQELVGVLLVVGKPPRVFSPTDQESLELFAPLAATAIRNARLYSDLQERVKELHKAQERLFHTANMTSLAVLAGGVAHQVRNPLAIISTSAQLLADHPEDEDLRQRCLQKICAATERASQIVGSLLRFANPQTDRMAAVDLTAVLNETLDLLEYEMTLRGIAVVREIATDQPPVHGNATGLQRVFLNLLLNAMNAMPHGGTLTVTTQLCREGQLEIRFRDTGVGIPAENLSRIFEPFFTTLPVGQGTGLGLSLSYSIIRQHGGTIEVESQEGQGSVSSVRLPCLTEADRNNGTGPSPRRSGPPTAAT